MKQKKTKTDYLGGLSVFCLLLINKALLRSYFLNSGFVFHQDLQTLENNKSTRPSGSSFHQFSRVWKLIKHSPSLMRYYLTTPRSIKAIEKMSSDAFQALWIVFLFEKKKKNTISGIVCRKHNSPESFQSYLDEVLESKSSNDKTIYIIGDFNISLLNVETCNFIKDFLLSLQSYSFFPTIDKPTRVNNNSDTLIDNIFANNVCRKKTSGNIISDISDHNSA